MVQAALQLLSMNTRCVLLHKLQCCCRELTASRKQELGAMTPFISPLLCGYIVTLMYTFGLSGADQQDAAFIEGMIGMMQSWHHSIAKPSTLSERSSEELPVQ